MAYLLQWVMIYPFGINLNSYNGSHWVMIYSFRINNDLGINPNSIPYPVNHRTMKCMNRRVVGFTLRFRLKFQIQFRWNHYLSMRIIYIHGKFHSVERWWFSAWLVPIPGFSFSKNHLILWGSHFGNEGQAT